MSEFLLRFSSKNREKVGVSLSHDFTTKFNIPIQLSYNMKHEVAVRLIKMTYSWYNISQSFGNNQINTVMIKVKLGKQSHLLMGCTVMMILMIILKKYMKNQNHHPGDDPEKYGINLYFVLSTYRILIELHEDYQVDLTTSDFRKLIGFNSKIVTSTEYGTNLPDITRGVDEVHINCDKVTDSITDRQSSNTLAVIPVQNLVRSLPFSYNLRPIVFSPLSGHLISSMRFYVTDSSGNPIDLNGIDWYIELIVKSTKI